VVRETSCKEIHVIFIGILGGVAEEPMLDGFLFNVVDLISWLLIGVVFMGIEVYWVSKRQFATVFSLQIFSLSFLFLILTQFDLVTFGVLLEIFSF
jgi:membrane protein required for beta-lactamase induction